MIVSHLLCAVKMGTGSSIERDGIACTSKLEQTLFDDMNGLCREFMAELLAAGAATAKNYEAEAGTNRFPLQVKQWIETTFKMVSGHSTAGYILAV